MRNCDYYKTPKELLDTYDAYCEKANNKNKCNKDCLFYGGYGNDCLANFAYAEYDEQLFLKPCRHCGGTAVLNESITGSNTFWVECEECRIQTAYGARSEVIEKWNRRTEQ